MSVPRILVCSEREPAAAAQRMMHVMAALSRRLPSFHLPRSAASPLFVFLLAVLFGIGLRGETVASMPQPQNYVNDYAGVLNQQTKDDLDQLCGELDRQAHAQIFVAIVHKIEGAGSVDEFGNELFAKWKPGPKESNRGILILLSMDDHKRWIEVGYGLEGILPDGKVGDIGRDMVPDLKAGNVNSAVRTGVDEISDVITKDAGITLQTPEAQPQRASHASSGGGIFGLLFFLFILFLFLRGGGGRGGPGGFLTGMLIGDLLGGRRRGGWGGGGGGWGDGGGGFGGGGGGFGGGEGGSSGGGGAGGSW